MLKKKNNNILENSFFERDHFVNKLTSWYISTSPLQVFLHKLQIHLHITAVRYGEVCGIVNGRLSLALSYKYILFLIALTLEAEIGFHFWMYTPIYFFLYTSAGSFHSLLRCLVAEFTLAENPAMTTTSLLRTVCHKDDSILLGSWLQETDHKFVEEQVCKTSSGVFCLSLKVI